jgi:ribonuclease-3
MDRMKTPDTTTLERLVGHKFTSHELLLEALTHRSYSNENPSMGLKSNERLEFLGDAVLALAVSHLLMDAFPHENEGQLSRRRALLVNEKALARKAVEFHLGDYLLLGKGEQRTGGRTKDSLLANALEALIGALYLDGGYATAAKFIKRIFQSDLQEKAAQAAAEDFKTRLQEVTQARLKTTPIYRVVSEEGPDHDKHFHVELEIGDGRRTSGYGRSKKEAEQQAAKKMLRLIQNGQTKVRKG